MNDQDVTTPQPYKFVLARNVAAARIRLQLLQSDLAARMRDQGWQFYPQTVSELEKGRRAIRAEELLGLAVALETTVRELVSVQPPAVAVVLPSGQIIGARRVVEVDGSTAWDGNHLKIAPAAHAAMSIDSLLAERRQELASLEAFREELHRGDAGEYAPLQPGDETAEDHPAGWRQPAPPDG